jgi:hypothetical protein
MAFKELKAKSESVSTLQRNCRSDRKAEKSITFQPLCAHFSSLAFRSLRGFLPEAIDAESVGDCLRAADAEVHKDCAGSVCAAASDVGRVSDAVFGRPNLESSFFPKIVDSDFLGSSFLPGLFQAPEKTIPHAIFVCSFVPAMFVLQPPLDDVIAVSKAMVAAATKNFTKIDGNNAFFEIFRSFLLYARAMNTNYVFVLRIINDFKTLFKQLCTQIQQPKAVLDKSGDFTPFFTVTNDVFSFILLYMSGLLLQKVNVLLMKSLPSGNDGKAGKLEPGLIDAVFKSFPNSFNKNVKNEEKELLSSVFQGFCQITGLGTALPNPALKPIASALYKVRDAIGKSRQETAKLADDSLAKRTLQQQYPLFIAEMKLKAQFLLSTNSRLPQNEANLKLLSDFVTSEMQMTEFDTQRKCF